MARPWRSEVVVSSISWITSGRVAAWLSTAPVSGEIERHDRDVFQMDVLPDVQLGPVRDGEHPDALTLGLLGIVETPELGALILRVPAVIGRAEREDTLLGAALLLVAARAAEGRIEAVFVERLFQAFGLPQIGMQAAMVERIDAARQGVRVLVDQQLHAAFLGHAVAQLVHG